jgi:ATP-dependent Clp protease ATP-binding subunit ClpB
VDDIVLFKPLTLDEIKRIVELQLVLIQKRLDDRRITLILTEAARDHIAQSGFDPVYGARPLKRLLQRELETRIGRKIIAGELEEGATVTADMSEGKLELRIQSRDAAKEHVEKDGGG